MGLCTYRWTISDNGHGYEQRVSCLIFLNHLYRKKHDARSIYQGTGLGMAIVKESD